MRFFLTPQNSNNKPLGGHAICHNGNTICHLLSVKPPSGGHSICHLGNNICHFNQHRGCNIYLSGLPSAKYHHNGNTICQRHTVCLYNAMTIVVVNLHHFVHKNYRTCQHSYTNKHWKLLKLTFSSDPKKPCLKTLQKRVSH